MAALPPLTLRSRRAFVLTIGLATSLLATLTLLLLARVISWIPLMRAEPTLVTLFLPVALFAAATAWMGRWTLFHATARVEVSERGLRLRSALGAERLDWVEIEAIHLQASSGSEVRFEGAGRALTVPSGSAPPEEATRRLQMWIDRRLGERELDYRARHFWGP